MVEQNDQDDVPIAGQRDISPSITSKNFKRQPLSKKVAYQTMQAKKDPQT